MNAADVKRLREMHQQADDDVRFQRIVGHSAEDYVLAAVTNLPAALDALEAAVEVLRPFAAALEAASHKHHKDGNQIMSSAVAAYITFGDLRRAAAIVRRFDGGQGGGSSDRNVPCPECHKTTGQHDMTQHAPGSVAPVLTGDLRRAAAIVRRFDGGQGECDDEGCPHYGTKHSHAKRQEE